MNLPRLGGASFTNRSVELQPVPDPSHRAVVGTGNHPPIVNTANAMGPICHSSFARSSGLPNVADYFQSRSIGNCGNLH